MTLHDLHFQAWVGFVAATLTTSAFVPQAVMILRTRNVAGISASMYWAFTAGVALWLAYGLTLQAWPLIIANSITLVLSSTILVTKLRVDAALRRTRHAREAREALHRDPTSRA